MRHVSEKKLRNITWNITSRHRQRTNINFEVHKIL